MKLVACAVGAGALWAQSQTAEQSKPQYYDEPNFIVAGVTDPTARGGHGADPVSHSVDQLAKAAAALRTGAAGTADEASLRQAIAKEPNRAELHHAVADFEEKRGDALEAVREYQRAAELEASERNLFDWGAELLEHRAAGQAIEVFSKGARVFPRSTRMLVGLAVALSERGDYDQAAQRFFAAADLNPADPEPYLFLGRVSTSSIGDMAGYGERMERFVRLHPENARANYYYGVHLWSLGQSDESRGLVEKAIRIDSHLAVAYVRLGIIFAEEGKLAESVRAFEGAVSAEPTLGEAHYRLSQAYRKVGEISKAQRELETFQRLERESSAAEERERAEIQQFVFKLRGR
jgi:tetratricopeptide (TPR) repeat protein